MNRLLKKLESKEEKELIEWSVKIGRNLNKKAFKKLLAKLFPNEKKELLNP